MHCIVAYAENECIKLTKRLFQHIKRDIESSEDDDEIDDHQQKTFQSNWKWQWPMLLLFLIHNKMMPQSKEDSTYFSIK